MIKLFLCCSLLLSFAAFSQSSPPLYVHFAFNRYELDATARARLDSLTDSLDLADRIELYGHCDATGSDSYNARLSEQRVHAVEKYLLDAGWEKKDILIAKGYGEQRPLAGNESATDRALNRRVEIRILSGKKNITLKEQLSDPNLKTDVPIVLPNIHFYGGLHQFLPISAPALRELLEAMQAFPQLMIQVEGHICCHPDAGDGMDNETNTETLSEERAKAVRQYLIQNGIAANRILSKGFGHSRPLHPYPEKTELEMQENRRVEIRILKK